MKVNYTRTDGHIRNGCLREMSLSGDARGWSLAHSEASNPLAPERERGVGRETTARNAGVVAFPTLVDKTQCPHPDAYYGGTTCGEARFGVVS
jgi:hypothetical protein